MTTIAIPAADLTAARRRNEAVWHQSSAALRAMRIDEFLAFWHEDGRYEVVYPIAGMPPAIQGHDALAHVFGGFFSVAARIEMLDVRVHQTDDPDVAFIEERMVVDLHDGGRYENRLAIRATFRDGLIAELYEYYGERRHEELLARLGIGG